MGLLESAINHLHIASCGISRCIDEKVYTIFVVPSFADGTERIETWGCGLTSGTGPMISLCDEQAPNVNNNNKIPIFETILFIVTTL